MLRFRAPFLALAVLGALLWTLPSSALADRIGQPYRGPSELMRSTSGDATAEQPAAGDTGESGDTGDTGESGDSGETGLVKGTGGERGKPAALDGSILWQWWWEHNKDRYIARLTESGRIQPGSAYFWFGAGAKFPPREIEPVSEAQRATAIFPALRGVLRGNAPLEVKSEACIAMGRLGRVLAPESERKENLPDNLVVRELIHVADKDAGLRTDAFLGLGIAGDPDGCAYLMANDTRWTATERPFVLLAYGLARYRPAIGMLVSELPTSARSPATDSQLAAIHALGLYGPGAVEEIQGDGRKGVDRIEKLVDARGEETTVSQAVVALARLQQANRTVTHLLSSTKAPSVQWSVLQACSYYIADEKDAEAAAKLLMTKGFKGRGQDKNFSVLALGDLAGRLDPNSKTRAKILKFISERVDEKKSNYVRACAALAVGLADDTTATPAVAELLRDTTVDDYVIGAACLSLGLLRATEYAGAVREVVLDQRWNADARGYALLGLALMGDTTRLGEIMKEAQGSPREQTERQISLAIGILGGKDEIASLLGFFSKRWIQKRDNAVSNAVYGLSWVRDQSAVTKLVDLVNSASDPQVRGMAVIALGYVGMEQRINPLARCLENMNHRNNFSSWDILTQISTIL